MELKKLGRYLQKERRARKISLRDIAGETRINIRYLKAIEEGRTEELPQDPYLTAFLKSYCQQVGLDFQEVKGMFSSEETSLVVEQLPPPSKRFWWGLLLLPILLLVIVLFPQKSKRTAVSPPLSGKPPDKSPVASSPPGSLSLIAVDTLPQGPPFRPDTLRLELVGLESTWVFIEGDSEVLWQGILTPGQRKVLFSSKGFQATVGNAGGLELFFNGKSLRRLGPRGKVVHNLRIDRGTIEGLLRQ